MSSRLVRSQSMRASSAISATVTFSEPTPLDSTHLLVLIVLWQSTNPLTVPSGWVEVPMATPNFSSIRQLRMYARQGDGTVNGATVSGGFAAKSMWLLGFSGYSTDVAEASVDTAYASADSPSLPSTPDVEGVVVAVVGTTNVPSDWGTWTNGFEFAGTPATNSLINPGVKDYTGPSGTYTTNLLVSGSGAAHWLVALFRLTSTGGVTVSYALGSTVVTLALGADEVTGIVGG